MIEQVAGPKNNVVRVQASGKLRREDFTKLFTLLHGAAASEGKIRLMIELRDFHGWDLHGLWDDFRFHTTHSSNIERIAYVGEKTWEKWLIGLARAFPGTPIRYFDAASLAAALEWLEER